MKKMMKHTLIGLTFLICFLWMGQTVFAATLTIDKSFYTVGVGQKVTGVVYFSGADTTIGGYLYLYTVSTSIATVSPQYITIQRHSAGYGVVDNVPFTISGVSAGSTILYVEAFYSNGSPIGISVYANVTVTDCPVSISLEDSQDRNAIDLLRAFRDEVLAKSTEGQKIIRSFYKHRWEGSYLLLKHPDLLLQSRKLLEQLLPAVQASIEGQTPELSQAEIDDIDAFLADVEALGSPSLKETIRELRTFIANGEVSSLF